MGHPKGRKMIVVLLFKDFKDEIQGLDLSSGTFNALQMRKKYKHFQGSVGTLQISASRQQTRCSC